MLASVSPSVTEWIAPQEAAGEGGRKEGRKEGESERTDVRVRRSRMLPSDASVICATENLTPIPRLYCCFERRMVIEEREEEVAMNAHAARGSRTARARVSLPLDMKM